MDYEQTQPLGNKTRRIEKPAARNIFRCPCGTDIDIDPSSGGKCQSCDRVVPGNVTQMSMTMTFSDATRGFAYADTEAKQDELADELIGQTLGHFEIIESIGRGGMGQVYRALDTSLQRYVAVKVIKGGTASRMDTQGQQRLMHEAVAQARVNHPNIVTIYYVGRENDTPFLAMELVDGYDASDLIKQGEVPYETLCSIAIKMTHALDVAAQTGIVHSDIKPQNLLILKNGEVKLSDFGMARMDEDDKHNLLGGTPNYLAPELLDGMEPSIKSDMYALGVTLFELTFARLPVSLSGSTLEEWSKIHAESKIEFPDRWPAHLPEKWKVVLTRLLEQDPEKRFQDYETLGKELQSILPTSRRPALSLARSIAWGLDALTMILALVVPIAMVASILDLGINIDNFVFLPALCLYSGIIYWWRQSIGRELVHVKILNQYGLTPARKTMVLRECMRMQLIWFIGIANILGYIDPLLEVIFVSTGVLLTIADFGYMAFIGRGVSLHDKIFKTQAAVGSDSH